MTRKGNFYLATSYSKIETVDQHYDSQIQFRLSLVHGLQTPNEGINQRYLKNWADVADKICFGHT